MALTDGQRDELFDAISGHPIGFGYYQTRVGPDEAREIVADLAPLIEQWIAEAEERARVELMAGWTEAVEWGVRFFDRAEPRRTRDEDTARRAVELWGPGEVVTRTNRLHTDPWQPAPPPKGTDQ